MNTSVQAADPVTAVIDELVLTRTATSADGAPVDISSFAIRREAGEVLEAAASHTRPRVSIEVGCASGLSSMYIARGRSRSGPMIDGSMHVIDPRQQSHWKDIGRHGLSRAGLDGAINFHEEPAHAVLPRLLVDGVRVQFAFIDGWHMLDYVMVEAFYLDLMLDVGGVVALHDLWMPGLQHFASFWCTNRSYEPVAAHGEELRAEPIHSERSEVGDLAAASPHFRERLAPFVHASVLLLRKCAEDRRPWDFHRDYMEA